MRSNRKPLLLIMQDNEVIKDQMSSQQYLLVLFSTALSHHFLFGKSSTTHRLLSKVLPPAPYHPNVGIGAVKLPLSNEGKESLVSDNWNAADYRYSLGTYVTSLVRRLSIRLVHSRLLLRIPLNG